MPSYSTLGATPPPPPINYRAEVRRQDTSWYTRITAIPIICTEGLIATGIHRGTTTGDVFLQFVNNKLLPTLLPFNGVNPRPVVVVGMTSITTFKTLRRIYVLRSNYSLLFGFQTLLPYIIRNALSMQSTLPVYYSFSFPHTVHILCLVKEYSDK